MRAVGVVVPAHDEEDDLPRCLASLAAAVGHPALGGLDVRVVAVLDACSDRSGERADAAPGGAGRRTRVVEVAHRNVGRARAAGVAEVLAATAGLDPAEVWVATTDADTTVPPDWLATQLRLAAAGWEALAGTVRVADWSGQPDAVRRRFARYLAETGTGRGHPHVHGANLAMTAEAYLDVGGVPPLALAEDHALWGALAASGRRVLSTSALPVVTSARREARAADGFGAFLRRLEAGPAR